jgi:sugar phosphate isomerase/epimerase
MINKVTSRKYSVTVTNRASRKVPVLLGGNINDCIEKAKSIGYDAIELHYSHPNEMNVSEAAKVLKNLNIQVSGIATSSTYVVHKLSLTDDSDIIREAAIKRVNEYVDRAMQLSSTVIIGCVRGNIKAHCDVDVYLNRLSESLKKVSVYAEARNVPIVLEAINRYENNFLNTALETLNFIKASKIPNLKILLDTFHMNIEEADICNSIFETREHIGYIHFSDSNRMYPGAGHIDFKAIINTLNDIGYEGYISAECLPLPDGDSAAKAWMKYLHTLN